MGEGKLGMLRSVRQSGVTFGGFLVGPVLRDSAEPANSAPVMITEANMSLTSPADAHLRARSRPSQTHRWRSVQAL